jgi:hypothetical protein
MSQPVLSYASEVAPPRWVRWLLNPIGWPYFSLLALACLWVLWQFRIPEPFVARMVCVFRVIPFLVVLLLLRLVLRLVLWRVYRRPWRAFLAGFWRFGVPVVVGLVVGLFLYLHLPQKAAWLISEPALRRHAQGLIAAEAVRVPPATVPTRLPPQWVGLYPMSDITYFPDVHGVRYFVAGAGFLDRQGFAYLPAGLTPGSVLAGWEIITPKEGDWYRTEEEW